MEEEKIEERNCAIKSTHLGYEDHGVFTAFIHLEGPGWGQGFGGFFLEAEDGDRTALFVKGVLDVFRKDTWESLPGLVCRIRASHSKVHAIGHYMEDRWFNFAEEVEKLKEEE